MDGGWHGRDRVVVGMSASGFAVAAWVEGAEEVALQLAEAKAGHRMLGGTRGLMAGTSLGGQSRPFRRGFWSGHDLNRDLTDQDLWVGRGQWFGDWGWGKDSKTLGNRAIKLLQPGWLCGRWRRGRRGRR